MRPPFNQYLAEPKRTDIAHLGKRIVAYLIDHFLVVLAIVLVGCGIVVLERMFGMPEWAFILITILISFVCTAYVFLKDGWDGRGVGKRIMGLQVIDVITGAPVSMKIAALRYLILRVLSLVEIVFIFVQPNHRGIGDWLGHSVVIQRK